MTGGQLEHSEEPVLLTVPQAAKLLQMSENTVYSLISQKVIPHTRFGKLIRVPKWGLLQLIAQDSGAPLPTSSELDVRRIRSVHADEPDDEED